MSTDLRKNLLLFTDKDLFVLNLANAKESSHRLENGETTKVLVVKDMKMHKDVKIQGARLFEDRFCYISHLKGSNHPSLKRLSAKTNVISILDLDNFNNDYRSKLFAVKVNEVVGGANSQVCYSETNKRILFLKSFNRVQSVPLLHNNTHMFKQMPQAKDILISRQIDDRLIVVDTSGNYLEFCRMTGKRIKKTATSTMMSAKNGYDVPDKQLRTLEGYKVFHTCADATSANQREAVMHMKGIFNHVLIYDENVLDNSQNQQDRMFYSEWKGSH